MQEHVGRAVVGDDEAVALGGVEPLDGARHLDEVYRRLLPRFLTDFVFGRKFRPHVIRPLDTPLGRRDRRRILSLA